VIHCRSAAPDHKDSDCSGIPLQHTSLPRYRNCRHRNRHQPVQSGGGTIIVVVVVEITVVVVVGTTVVVVVMISYGIAKIYHIAIAENHVCVTSFGVVETKPTGSVSTTVRIPASEI